MEKALKRKKIWLILGLFSIAGIIIGTPLLAFTALKGIYVPMVILIILVGHGFWGAPFYFLGYSRMKTRIKLIRAVVELGMYSTAELSGYTGLKESEVKRFAGWLVKHKILVGYKIEKTV